jgi:HEAT repeat protein
MDIHRVRVLTLVGLCFFAITNAGCAGSMLPQPTPTLETEWHTRLDDIPLPETVSAAIRMLESGSPDERIVAAQVIPTLGAEATRAIPALIANLHDPQNSEVRRFAVQALGYFGAESRAAVPALVSRLQHSDSTVLEREAIARALGKIGDPRAVSSLVPMLYDQDTDSAIVAAESMGILGKQMFPDQGKRGYRTGDDGIPLIVAAARTWWEQEGKHQDWSTRKP